VQYLHSVANVIEKCEESGRRLLSVVDMWDYFLTMAVVYAGSLRTLWGRGSLGGG